jgi:hypothetical protein
MNFATVCLVVQVMPASSGGIEETVISIRRLSMHTGRFLEEANRRAQPLAWVDPLEHRADAGGGAAFGDSERLPSVN